VRLSVRLAGQDYQPLADGPSRRKSWCAGPTRPPREQVGAGRGDHRRRRRARRSTCPDSRPACTGCCASATRRRQAASRDVRHLPRARRPGPSSIGRSGDADLLESIALATGGQALGAIDELPADLPFAAPRVVRVDQRADVELWSRPSLLVVAVLLLGLEWLLRQRAGYL
jgi:hypothetical protein